MKRIWLDVLASILLSVVGFVMPLLRKWNFSLFSGLSLAAFYIIWRWFNNLRKTSSISESAIALRLSFLPLAYEFVVYIIGIFRPSIFVVYMIPYIIINSVITSIVSIIVYLIGFYAEGVNKDIRSDVISILTSILTLVSLISIAVTYGINVTVGSYQRAICMSGYGFLAVATYSLGYLSKLLNIVKVNALLFLLSGIFGLYFGIIIWSMTQFNVFAFSFSAQAMLIIGLFIANNYIEQTLHYLHQILAN